METTLFSVRGDYARTEEAADLNAMPIAITYGYSEIIEPI